MNRAVIVHRTGGPEVLAIGDLPVAAPGPGEALIRQTAVGVNFIDIYHRTGLYPLPLPFVPGSEGVGVVEAVGADVTEVAVGDRVAYANVQGAYCERRVVPSRRLVRIPEGIDPAIAAASFVKGLTAWFLLHRTYRVGPETTLLFHAAAGGVGLIACQWAAALGATVIGTVGSDEKAAVARANGCTQVINYRSADFVGRVREITGGRGVDVVYDSVGNDTFPASLDALRPLGTWVSFGNASGPVPPFSPLLLMQKGSLFMTRPTLLHYVAARGDLERAAAALFSIIASGAVKVRLHGRFDLAEAGAAQAELASRATVGSLILTP